MDEIRTHVTSPCITADIGGEIIDAHGTLTSLRARLRYQAGDPYAVEATFVSVAGKSTWTFARDLLVDGLLESTGDGDLHVWPGIDENGCTSVFLDLCSPYGSALITLPAGPVRDFLDQSRAAVPLGTESNHLDLDHLVARLLTAV